MARVFLLEHTKAGIDVSKARAFGDLLYVFQPQDRRPSIFRVEQFIDRVLDELDTLKFNPGEDYFCLAGATAPLILVTAALHDVYGDIKLLMFSGNDDTYVEKVLKSRRTTAA